VDNWDWALWTRTLGLERSAIQIQHVFDTDDAALHAATAGLGMVLAPAFLTEREIRSGGLVVCRASGLSISATTGSSSSAMKTG
jgi:LysR family glycine cleavage system transcriptional activator